MPGPRARAPGQRRDLVGAGGNVTPRATSPGLTSPALLGRGARHGAHQAPGPLRGPLRRARAAMGAARGGGPRCVGLLVAEAAVIGLVVASIALLVRTPLASLPHQRQLLDRAVTVLELRVISGVAWEQAVEPDASPGLPESVYVVDLAGASPGPSFILGPDDGLSFGLERVLAIFCSAWGSKCDAALVV